MAEELVMTVKSDIKTVTKDFKELNSTLNEQKKILSELKQEEIKLQQERLKMSAWERSISGIDKKIEHLKFSIKDQTLAVKDLTSQQGKASKELKKFSNEQKEQDKAIKGTIGNFQVFGVSLNGIKKSVKGIIPLIRLMFKSITAGLLSTGIGAFLIAFGSLVTFVTSTKEGMDKLNVVLAKMGAAFNVVKDRIAGFGKIIGNIFTKPFSETISDVKDNFKGMGEEIKEDTKLAGELEKATQKLRDIENKFIVTRAKKNKQLAEARLLSEDETTSLEERRLALEDAIKLEKQLLQDELDQQAERVRILKEKTEMSNSTAADEKALAEERVRLIELETKSLTTQKRLKREMNSLDNEIAADKEAASKAAQKLIDDEWDAKIKKNDEWNEAQQKQRKKDEKDAKKLADTKIAITEAEEKAKESLIKQGFGIASSLAGENVALSKGVAMAQTVYQTQQAIMAALGATSVGDKLLPYPLRLANAIGAGIMGATALAKIASTDPTGGGASAGAPTASSSTPSPQMMAGSFELTGGQEVEPMQAYVVSDDITNNQNALAIIRRRATI